MNETNPDERKEFSQRLLKAMGFELLKRSEIGADETWIRSSYENRVVVFIGSPDFTSTKNIHVLLDWLKEENTETEGVGTGITWGLWQGQKGGYSAGINPDGQTPWKDFDGDTPGEVLGWAIIGYVEYKEWKEKQDAARE